MFDHIIKINDKGADIKLASRDGDLNLLGLHLVLKNPFVKIGNPLFLESTGPRYTKFDLDNLEGSNTISSIWQLMNFSIVTCSYIISPYSQTFFQ